jgi:hypothetical protein
MSTAKQKDFWASTLIIAITVFLMIVIILHWLSIGFLVGPFRLNHWFVWIGTIYIAFAVPVIAILKRRNPNRIGTVYRLHVFGNLLAFSLISLHFASQISRPADRYPDLGTGLVLYIAMILLVGTGFLLRFRLLPKIKPQTYRFVHTGSAVAFYLIIIVHILQGLGIL